MNFIENKFNIGDIVRTKNNEELKIESINIFINKTETIIKYQLEGYKVIFFYEEDLELI